MSVKRVDLIHSLLFLNGINIVCFSCRIMLKSAALLAAKLALS